MKKIDLANTPEHVGTDYPPPYDEQCKHRARQRPGDLAGLMQFGVNLLRLSPGQWWTSRTST